MSHLVGGEDDLGFESYLHFLVKLQSLISVDPAA
jgi:hypothetical protein